jgi:hypothetical protein
MKDFESLSDQDFVDLQRQIEFERQRRLAERGKKDEKYLASAEAQTLKSAIKALESELSLLPKKVDLNQKITLKLLAETNADSVVDIIENGDDPFGLVFELDEFGFLTEDLKNSIDASIDDMNMEYNPAGEFLMNSYEGRQWAEFLQKLKDLEPSLQALYDADLEINDLMEE